MMVPAGALGYRISTDHHLQVITAASFGDIPAKNLGPGSVVFGKSQLKSFLDQIRSSLLSSDKRHVKYLFT